MKRKKIRAKNRDPRGSIFGSVCRVTPKLSKTSEFRMFCGSKGEFGSSGHRYIGDPTSVEQVRNWMLIVQDAADTITNQTRARRVRGWAWKSANYFSWS